MSIEIAHEFNVGDVVVIWSKSGDGIYDGNTVYVRDFYEIPDETRYGLSEQNEGDAIGYLPTEKLLPLVEFQALVDSGELERIWQGEDWKLESVLKHYRKLSHVVYQTETKKGSTIKATIIRGTHIEIVVLEGLRVLVEWHWNIDRAAQRFQWLLENA